MQEIADFRGFLWLALTLAPLALLQRSLHRAIQTIFLALTRRADLAMFLFSLVFLPGVLLHEGSHYLAARLLGVRTGHFSIFPRPLPGGQLQLGFVETAAADPLRETLIGAAPLISGLLFVFFAGVNRLDLPAVWLHAQAGGFSSAWAALTGLFARQDFWLWFYLLFTISSTMLPSAADRHAWLPVALVGVVLLGLSLLAGLGPWLLAHLAVPLDRLFAGAAILFFISDLAHLILLLPTILLAKLLIYIRAAEQPEYK